MICSVGLERRDYRTLCAAVEGLDVDVVIAVGSHWSTQPDLITGRPLPPNVSVCTLDFVALRALYAECLFVVMPLVETDFQAGVTTILEAMAMGKAVVCSATSRPDRCPRRRSHRAVRASGRSGRAPSGDRAPARRPRVRRRARPGRPCRCRGALRRRALRKGARGGGGRPMNRRPRTRKRGASLGALRTARPAGLPRPAVGLPAAARRSRRSPPRSGSRPHGRARPSPSPLRDPRARPQRGAAHRVDGREHARPRLPRRPLPHPRRRRQLHRRHRRDGPRRRRRSARASQRRMQGQGSRAAVAARSGSWIARRSARCRRHRRRRLDAQRRLPPRDRREAGRGPPRRAGVLRGARSGHVDGTSGCATRRSRCATTCGRSARTALGGSCGLYGNGMAFRVRGAARSAWTDHLTEDMELQLELLLDGVLVAYAPDAVVEAEMPTSLAGARTQTASAGSRAGSTSRAASCPAAGRTARVRRRHQRVGALDAAVDQVIPPFSVVVAATVITGVAGAALGRSRPSRAARLAVLLAAGIAAAQALYVFVGLRLVHGAARRCTGRCCAHRCSSCGRCGCGSGCCCARRRATWVRTARNGEPDRPEVTSCAR